MKELQVFTIIICGTAAILVGAYQFLFGHAAIGFTLMALSAFIAFCNDTQ